VNMNKVMIAVNGSMATLWGLLYLVTEDWLYPILLLASATAMFVGIRAERRIARRRRTRA